MRSLHRLKAYFGMVPAEDMDDYLDDDEDSDDLDREYLAESAVPPQRVLGADRTRYADPAVRAGSRTLVRGALAVDPYAEELATDEPAILHRDAGLGLPVERGAVCRITTLAPRSYNEARTVGERYRDGIPVIMNLTDLDDAAAKRLVDFAAGLAFALRGSIDKVTSRVFLLSPPGVEVAPSDARRLAEHGFFGQD